MKKLPLLFILSVIMFVSCEDEDTKPELVTDNVLITAIDDVGNSGHSGDISIKLFVADVTGITRYQVIIRKSSDMRELKLSDLQSLETSKRYEAMISGSEEKVIRLPEGISDLDGNAIEENVEYYIQVYTPENEQLSKPSSTISLGFNDFIEGRYRGTWNDNLFTNIQVSAIIELQKEATYQGTFYISSDFTAGWGGENDGTIQFEVEGDSIVNFVYNQQLETYMGGCPGQYTGKGIFVEGGAISIIFIGEDCDGFHEDGVIALSR